MPTRTDDLKLLAELCDDAVAAHGADIRKIENYVESAIARLPLIRQRALRTALAEFLADQKMLASPGVMLFSRH